MSRTASPGVILIVGASRGLGLGLTREFLARSWQVIATARDTTAGPLAELAQAHPNQLRLRELDLDHPAQTGALHHALQGTRLDAVFVVAGISLHVGDPIHQVPPPDAARELMTNAVAPVVFAEAMLDLIKPGAAIVFMTSLLGSVASNTAGGFEIYRASKAALNMLARSFSVRHKDLPVLLMHPGWVRTDMGGQQAPLDVETSVRGMADVIAADSGEPGIRYLDYAGKTIPW